MEGITCMYDVYKDATKVWSGRHCLLAELNGKEKEREKTMSENNVVEKESAVAEKRFFKREWSN